MKKILIGVLIGCLFSIIFFKSFTTKSGSSVVDNKTDGEYSKYPYLAKRIFLDSPNDTILNLIDLREKLKKYILSQKDKIGFYFEYLPTGVNIGVNEKDEFYRASLIKLPLIMRAYKMIEDGSIKKDEILKVRRDLLDRTYGDLWKNGAGTDITLIDVIDLILTKSDNTAYNILLDRVNQVLKEKSAGSEKGIGEVYDFFDLPKSDQENNYQVTPKSYSSILKSLFFSSYLSYDSSSEILDIMTKSTFTDSLPKFIPKDVKISHKNGSNQEADLKKSVHSDCGIIYIPNRQYILCVMVNSSDEITSFKYISEISKIVYDYVSTVNK
jgi:beta-lactamase class A